jgi:hypothetical protein
VAKSQGRFFHPRKLNHATRTVTTRRLIYDNVGMII